ncbi:MAG: ROK family protein [Nanoarchaeota archaeon]|nr:ROK family protein [Nanoarchaeota archaeon]
MKPNILALDIGGTSVKAAIYQGNKPKSAYWLHNYLDCGLEEAKSHLVEKIKGFFSEKVDAVGIGIAGLIATDDSLYRSTVLTSFEGFNIPKFIKGEFNTDVVTIDNDADCGAFSEYGHFQRYRPQKKDFFYVVVGTGIGSAYVDREGNLPYIKRFDPNHKFSDNDNPLPNDLGLQLGIPRETIYQLMDFHRKSDIIEKALVDKEGNPLLGPNDNPSSIRIDQLASARGLQRIMDILLPDKESQQRILKAEAPSHYWDVCDKSLSDEVYRGQIISDLANYGGYWANEAFKYYGRFLGYAISKTVDNIRANTSLHPYSLGKLDIPMRGPIIINSFDFFEGEVLSRCKNCRVYPSLNSTSNVEGAYLQARKDLENK